VQTYPLDAIKRLHIIARNADANSVYFLTKDQNLAQFDNETKAVIPREIGFANDNVTISAMTIYNGKLYTLDTTNDQLYKHNKTQTGYDKGTSWLTGNSLDFSTANSVSVDGNIYIGHSTGEITKLFRGEKQSFEISGLDPVLKNISAIWTSNDADSIFVLDSTQKRVVQLSKDGVFKKQYTSDVWQSPNDMFVDEANNTVYVLDRNILYKFGL